jgi:hypothetical protein
VALDDAADAVLAVDHAERMPGREAERIIARLRLLVDEEGKSHGSGSGSGGSCRMAASGETEIAGTGDVGCAAAAASAEAAFG